MCCVCTYVHTYVCDTCTCMYVGVYPHACACTCTYTPRSGVWCTWDMCMQCVCMVVYMCVGQCVYTYGVYVRSGACVYVLCTFGECMLMCTHVVWCVSCCSQVDIYPCPPHISQCFDTHGKDLPTSRPVTPVEGTDSTQSTPDRKASPLKRVSKARQPAGQTRYSASVVQRWKNAMNHPDFKLVVS